MVSKQPVKRYSVIKEEKKPILKLYSDLIKPEREIVNKFIKTFGMSQGEAIETLFIPEKYMEWKSLQQRKAEVDGIASLPDLFKAMDEKLSTGSLTQVKEAWLSIGIALDKNFGQKTRGSMPVFQIGGEQVNIRVNFPFQPYQKTRVIEGETDDK